MLGFAAGVMIAASLFGLLVPSFRLGGIWITVTGFVIGIAFLDRANLVIPHLHRLRGREGPSATLCRVWLLLMAMGIHNIPEGLAVGISFGEDDQTAGLMIAMGIGLQNIPEGLAIAFPLVREGYSGGDLCNHSGVGGTRMGSRWYQLGDSGQVSLTHRVGVRRWGDALCRVSRNHSGKPQTRIPA